MSGVDTAFLYAETRAWQMHVSALLVLDRSSPSRGFDPERFVSRIEARIHRVPQFRWRLRTVPLGLDRPVWVDDTTFDVRSHVHRIGCPAPGAPRDLAAVAADLIGIELDRDRPLWEVWLIEGVEGAEVAILAKVHHSLVDGVAGLELVSLLFDLDPDAADETPQAWHPVDGVPTRAGLLGAGLRASVTAPARFLRLAGSVARQARGLAAHLGDETIPALPFLAPRTSLNAEICPQRRFASASVDLGEVKEIKDTFGVKVNDVVLAIVAGALRDYLDGRGELPDRPLVAHVPVSTRDPSDPSYGTKVGVMFVSLATDVPDPSQRLAAIARSALQAKEVRRDLAARKRIDVTEALAPALISLATRAVSATHLAERVPPVFNVIVSNIAGPEVPLHTAGAELVAVYPMGPLIGGVGLNVTVTSYRGAVHFGFLACRRAVPDPWPIADGVERSFAALREAVLASHHV